MIEIKNRWTGAVIMRVNGKLAGADLTRADLAGADLTGANLAVANLTGANLTGANLARANLAEMNPLSLLRTSIVPEVGEFQGWKLCQDGVVVRIRIPADSRRSSATGRKCRAEFVDVLEVVGAEEGVSIFNNTTIYRAGERIHCDHWEPDLFVECGGGIHFYLSRMEAEHHF